MRFAMRPDGSRGSALRRAAGILTLLLSVAAWALGLEYVRLGTRLPVSAEQVQRGRGHLYRIPVAVPLPGGDLTRSTLVVLENGRRLGPPRSELDAIRERGRGGYRHTGGMILFSTSDNSDPRRNGRRYELWLDPAPQRPALAALLLLAGAAGLPAVVSGLCRGAAGRTAAGPALLLWVLAAQAVLLLHREEAMVAARTALWTVILVAAAAALAAEHAGEHSLVRRLAARLPFALVGAGFALGAFAAARFAVIIRPQIGGVDFFYYLCNARDLSAGAASPDLFRYFPGVYLFWSSAMALAGGGIPEMQRTVLFLVAANALLLPLVLHRVGIGWIAGGAAALWYVVLASRFEGFYGDTEPICTLALLAGLLAWGGKSGGWRVSGVRLVALGAGIGLAFFTKQTAGLLSLGWLALPGAALAAGKAGRPLLRAAFLVPGAALLSLAAGFAVCGGTAALRAGLTYVSAYPAQGEGFINIAALADRAGPVPAAALVCCLGAVIFLAVAPSHRARLLEPRLLLLTFCTIAAAATIFQFLRRPYPHYALLPLPPLILAGTILAEAAWRRIDAATGGRAPLRILAAGLPALLLVQAPVLHAFQVWPLPTAAGVGVERPWRGQPEIARDLAALAPRVRPGENVLLLPPRRNEVHYVLGTRTTGVAGYNWPLYSVASIRDLSTPSLSGVIVLEKAHLNAGDAAYWSEKRLDAVVASLPGRGFQRDTVLPTMTLWRPGGRSDPGF